MVESGSAYAEWVHEWARVTGAEGRVTGIDSAVDVGGGTSWLSYTLDGVTRRLEFRQDDDWLVPEVADAITTDFGSVPGRTRLYLDNGQGGTYVWLPPESVAEFRALFPEAEEG